MAMHLALAAELQSVEPSARISMYELHFEGSITRFHAGVNEFFAPLVWQGNEYIPLPITAEGFEVSTSGNMPRPILRVANIKGVISELLKASDISGAKLVRRRTLARYLDAVNFKGGNPYADPTAELPQDIFIIDQRKGESSSVVEFELRSTLEMTGVMLPRRQIIQNSCSSGYRSAECGYAGGPVADIHDNPTSSIVADQCGKRLKSCKLRFPNSVLPFGGFPAAGLVRV